MVRPQLFVDVLKSFGIEFYTGVPDSLLKNLCAYITDNMGDNNIIAANEGGAVGIATGYHLSTGKIPVVYMQNSGEGNVVNPFTSLIDKEVYNIPMLFVIGWRGEPGVHDEPQHVKQGRITLTMLDTLEIPYIILDEDETLAETQLRQVCDSVKNNTSVYAIIIRKNTFDTYVHKYDDKCDGYSSREDAIKKITASLEDNSCVVSTTGMISRELYEYRDESNVGHSRDFLTVGAMGHASTIALGIALHCKDRKIYCFDGDGASIMHMGNMAIIASKKPQNMVHIVFNNGAHDSVGGQPTVGFDIRLGEVASALGYEYVLSTTSVEEAIDFISKSDGLTFVEIKVRKGNRSNLGRPKETPIENKVEFMKYLGSYGESSI